jgi:cysteine desulfurase
VAAYQEACDRMGEDAPHLSDLGERLWADIHARIPEAIRNTPFPGVPGMLHLSFPGVHSEALLLELDCKGIYASSGSACSAGEPGPSHVVRALGLPVNLANGCLRLSLGRSSRLEQLPSIVQAVADAYARLDPLGS